MLPASPAAAREANIAGFISSWRTGRIGVILAGLALLGACSHLQALVHGKPDPADQRTQILAYLSEISAKGQFLAGTQVNEYEVSIACDSMDRLVAMTGEEQAMLGMELMFAATYPDYADRLVAHAVEHTRRGGLVTLAWHQRNPLRVCPRGEFYDCSKTPMDESELVRMLTPGTPEHALWKADVAASAETLKRLQAKGVPVLFRPYHEMNGDWFWWGRKEHFPELWDALHEELVQGHGLDNLIWVWSGDRKMEDAERYWPKRHLPDVVGTDVYETANDSPSYTDGLPRIRALAANRPFAFTEVGRVPADTVLEKARPSWVLVWGGEFLNSDWVQTWDCSSCNTEAETRAFFARPEVIALAEMPTELRTVIASRPPRPDPDRPGCASRLLEPAE